MTVKLQISFDWLGSSFLLNYTYSLYVRVRVCMCVCLLLSVCVVCAMCVGMFGRSAKSMDEFDKELLREYDLIDDDVEKELCDLERKPRGKLLTHALTTRA